MLIKYPPPPPGFVGLPGDGMKGEALKKADMASLRVTEKLLDRLARAAQSDLSQIRREIKRRKRARS